MTFKPDPKELYFIPLGGSEQFGVNFNLYAYNGKWLGVDCGIGFADFRFPGVDILLPDPSFIEQYADDLEALIITHAHEDHVGAVSYLWPRLRCAVYCTPFTAAVLRKKISERPESKDMRINEIRPGDKVDLGPFKAQFIHVAHSIPDTCSVVIETKAGRVVHSGDWNLDPSPVLGQETDEKAFQDIGKKGVTAYIGDSTNAAVPGRAGSESIVEKGLEKVFRECKGRVAITIFASNIGRIQSVYRAAKACGREVALVGRSLHSMSGAAFECGYLQEVERFLDEDEIGDLPDEKQAIIVTGSQGEARAALARIARGEHRNIRLGRGDTVIFSARPIPGNEKDIDNVKNNLVAAGVKVIGTDDTKHTIHVSGHPYRDEIADMYQWLKPGLVVPVHGERIQLEAQAALARKCQIKDVIVPSNGSVIKIAPGVPELVDHVETGLLAIEPNRVIRADHPAITQRRKLQYDGALHVTLVVNERGDLLADPKVTSTGLIDREDETELVFEDEIAQEAQDILNDMDPDDRYDDHLVSEEVRIGLRRMVSDILRLKPRTSVHVIRI